jgi:biotin carboxyl carrier protein
VAPVTRIGPGVYRVESDGRQHVVYVAGRQGELWAFWNGEVFHDRHDRHDAGHDAGPERVEHDQAHTPQALSSPMPATVVKVFVVPGAAVTRGDTLIALEAMKMEMPIRADRNGVVKAIHCREGELVQSGQTLVELE